MNGNAARVRQACETCYDEHKGDCSGFARAVAAGLGVDLGNANADQIVAILRGGGLWAALADGVAAQAAAAGGGLVMAGLRGDEQAHPDPHGHVVVVVAGTPLAFGKYPFAYWGSLGGSPGHDETLNWAWTVRDRDRISYACHAVNAPAGPGQ